MALNNNQGEDKMAPKPQTSQAMRPDIQATRHVVAAGHYMAAQAAMQILEGGGNAVDAGVAAGIATGVLESEFVSFAGVAPIILYMAKTRKLVTISGLGVWPKAISSDYFQKNHGGKIPRGIPRSIVPSAPDAWITALEKFGTMSFGEVAGAAIRFARDGFPMYPTMAGLLEEKKDLYKDWPSSAAVYLKNGEVPEVGKLFVQDDLGKSIQYMVDQEAAQSKNGRAEGLQAARDAFYRGDIAAAILKFHGENGGLLTAEDFSEFRVAIEPPVQARFGKIDVYGCGPWCQGPMMLQALSVLDGIDLQKMGHNSTAYIHTLVEAIKLAAADRDAYYGDPRFVDVPMDVLLSKEYADARRAMIRPDQAWPEMPAAGDVGNGGVPWKGAPMGAEGAAESDMDTSYLCVMDKDGNAFSATPSDGSPSGPVVPGTGLVSSPRGSQSWADPNHPCCVEPGKRPRLTPNPAMAMVEGEMIMPFGSPGGDVQTQAMLQVFLNIFVWGMDTQAAIEAPRFATYSFPASFEPHDYQPGLLKLEGRIDKSIGDELASLGHRIEWWADRVWMAGSVCAILKDQTSGIMRGGADIRRTAYAVGW
jgi:gamma-glutamyltranspeptidase / glutathione hydrolase